MLKLLIHEVPSLPIISIRTLEGLPPWKTNNPDLKMVQLLVRNTNSVELDNFCSRLQLPEPIIETDGEPEKSVGTQVIWRSLLNTNILVNGTGGRTEGGAWVGAQSMVYPLYVEPCFIPEMFGKRGSKGAFLSGITTGVWELQIDKLPPGGYVMIRFITSKSSDYKNYLSLANTPLWQEPPHPSTIPDTNELRFYFEGQYQFQSEIRPGTQHFFVPLMIEANSRNMSSLPVQSDVSHWHPVTLQFQ